MNMPELGYMMISNNDPPLIGCLIIRNGIYYEHLYNPSEQEVDTICTFHGVNPEEIIRALREKNAGIHTMMIDVEIYKKAHNL